MNILKRLFGNGDESTGPSIDLNYACESCGSTDGKCHPDTGMCWHCGADDFLPMESFKLGKGFFHALVVPGFRGEGLYFTKDGKQVYDELDAYWIAVNDNVYHRKEGYLAYTLPK